eukprot:TRINITY_DN658_c0_g1_i8.p2 TRINITY_DN658_c0_g1~~TRINITY_DN658_c0_g1_i8.p2  ORF type:complete len:135 (+),score=35.34 TRINITY_DN658_c0_g1_i8:882-1286(+)
MAQQTQVEKKRGNMDEALQLHSNALQIFTDTFGPSHEKVAGTLNLIAEVYRKQGNCYDGTAEGHYVTALEINHAVFGAEHPEIAENLNGLAQVYKAQMNYPKAEKLFLQAIAMSKKLLGETSPHVLNRYKNKKI